MSHGPFSIRQQYPTVINSMSCLASAHTCIPLYESALGCGGSHRKADDPQSRGTTFSFCDPWSLSGFRVVLLEKLSVCEYFVVLFLDGGLHNGMFIKLYFNDSNISISLYMCPVLKIDLGWLSLANVSRNVTMIICKPSRALIELIHITIGWQCFLHCSCTSEKFAVSSLP